MAGRVWPIVQIGDPVLSRACAPVTRFDESLNALVEDMFVSMRAAQGVGLAANQIGTSLRVFVYDCPDISSERQIGVVVNPVLRLPPSQERVFDDSEEACLSVLGKSHSLARSDVATVTGFDTGGEPLTVHGTGLLARCLQHECDHLDGLLYIDRLTAKQRRSLSLHAAQPSH